METVSCKCVQFASSSKPYDGLSQISAAVEQIIHMAFVLRTLRTAEDLDTALACVGMFGSENSLQITHIAAYKHILKLIERLSRHESGKSSVVWPADTFAEEGAGSGASPSNRRQFLRCTSPQRGASRKRFRAEPDEQLEQLQLHQNPSKCANISHASRFSAAPSPVPASAAVQTHMQSAALASFRRVHLREECASDRSVGSSGSASDCISKHRMSAACVLCDSHASDVDVGSPSTENGDAEDDGDNDDAASGSTDNPNRGGEGGDGADQTCPEHGIAERGTGQTSAECFGEELEESSSIADGTPVLPAGGGRAMKITTAHLPWLVKLARLQYYHIQNRHVALNKNARISTDMDNMDTARNP